MNIPRGVSFLADIASARKEGDGFAVIPVFGVQNDNVRRVMTHVGITELEVVVVGSNFDPITRRIKFRFDGQSPALVPSI
jgi:hypothetical protein